jgi:hypothetical protein
MAAFVIFMVLIAMIGLQLASGKIGVRGSTLERERNPKGFWIGIAFEIVLLLALVFGIVSGLAR